MIEDVQTLVAAIESGYLKDERWITWSERALIEFESVPTWLIGLYEAETPEAALAELYKGWHQMTRTVESIDQTELLLGFIYLRYLAGEIGCQTFFIGLVAYLMPEITATLTVKQYTHSLMNMRSSNLHLPIRLLWRQK